MTEKHPTADLRQKKKTMKLFIATAAAAMALLAPVSALADPFRPGVKDQIDLGQRAADKVRKEQKVLPDTDPRVMEMRRIGAKLISLIPAKERKDRPFQYTFDVVEDKELNAFALPGGPIFFNSGLLDKLSTEDQVAGILAHEITHVRNQHWASAYADNSKRQLGITAVLLLIGAGNTAFDVAGVADALIFSLPYSRKHETDADNVGFDLATTAGYNPQGMVDTFKILKAGSGGKKTEEWISTHPDTDKRISNLEKKVKESGKTYPTQRPRAVPAKYKPPVK